MNLAQYDDFLKLDIRVGKILAAKPFPEARIPAFQLSIDFGEEIGIKKTSAQITQNYSLNDLQDKLIAAITNFPPKQIGPFMSEVLVLGFPDNNGHVVLISPEQNVPIGGRLY